MIIERKVKPFIVTETAPLRDALKAIDANRTQIVFIVDEHSVLKGALSDGDFRRWLIGQDTVDLDLPVSSAMNCSPRAGRLTDDDRYLDRMLESTRSVIPLLDDRGRIAAIVRHWESTLIIEGHKISEATEAFVIAEIGINHNGSLELGFELIEKAAAAGADCAKFQMRDMKSLYRNSESAVPDDEDLGAQYVMSLLETHSLTNDDMLRLFDRCRERNLVPLCTPWDLESLEVLERYGIGGLKAASADLTNEPLLTAMADTGLPVIASTGMSSEVEIKEAVSTLRSARASFALLHCNSTYPAPYKDVNLRYLDRLKAIGNCLVGYSGHERGYEVPIAAIGLGAKIIEKHFTLDRNMIGNDHKVSLLPDEFASMVARIRNVEEAMGTADVRHATQGELMNRVNLAKSLVAARNLSAGHVIEEADLDVKSPGRGLQPNRKDELVGKSLVRNMQAGDFFYADDLTGERRNSMSWSFNRPFGVPVRFHDYEEIYARSTPDFLEFHLTYRDMQMDLGKAFPSPLRCEVAVHAPDLFDGDHILNLASDVASYRDRSVAELQRTVEVAASIASNFEGDRPPILIASLGGFTSDQPVKPTERLAMYEQVAKSLERVDLGPVRLVAQTLPPFPWYLGGQLICNLFVDPADTADFARTYGYRLCLDISHTQLAVNYLGQSLSTAISQVGPFTDHLHLVDAIGVDGEGIQIGEGDVDWGQTAIDLDEHCPGVGFIPEIWMGHRNGGEGFWTALDRLERWFAG
jgi:N-acetylneuraminate synthase